MTDATAPTDATCPLAGIGHNSHSGMSPSSSANAGEPTTAPPSDVDAETIATIQRIRAANDKNLRAAATARQRRDEVLTDAVLVLAGLLASGIDTRPDDLVRLSTSLEIDTDWRTVRVVPTMLARLVCGPGRTTNTYTNLAQAAAHLATLPEDKRRACLLSGGGVTGVAAAARRGDANKTPSDDGATTGGSVWTEARVRMAPDLLLALQGGDDREHRVLLRRGADDRIEVVRAEEV